MSLSKSKVETQLEIAKSSGVMQMMNRFLMRGTEVKSLSPTAIRHYLDCSLRFYFRYVVRIRERERESTELDPRDFGNIVHHALEKLYEPYLGETITDDRVEEILNSQTIAKVVDWSIKTHFSKSSWSVVEGKDVLHQQIIEKLIYKVVQWDRNITPFKLLGTEMKISTDLEFKPGHTIRLEGTLDRVHKAKEVTNIIDYKTGRADLKNVYGVQIPGNAQAYVKTHFEEPRYKSGFQGFFYGYLWNKNNGDTPVRLGIYPLKKVNDGVRWLNYDASIPPSGLEEFEKLLLETLNELFDETKPFTQTEDSDLCRFCEYKEICQR